MPKEPLRILAINPGTRYLGIAAFRGPELLDWRIAVVRSRILGDSEEITRRVVVAAIANYHPDVLAIKRLHRSRSSALLRALTAMIRRLARRRSVQVRQYTIQDMKAILCHTDKTNKRKVAEFLANIYPALAHDFRQESHNRNLYRTRMFEAVALGSVCYEQLENH